ncbi:terpene synthase family protein [Amycolatopsis sp. cmx-11-12]|uniref:terpene synthase family protein n=1 Tax=Amycolatopsis sp. cmx-11-12 TaxID=2785795 RepID=UPI003917BB84
MNLNHDDQNVFKEPEFPMPFQMRVNPHLDVLLQRSENWARATGMLSGGGHPDSWMIWDNLSMFHAIAAPELTAYCWPVAPSHEAALIHDAMVWYFAFDDHFQLQYKVARDIDGAREHVQRLSNFMPLASDEPVPSPSNAVEEGLADLWPRLIFARPKRWCGDWKDGINRFCDSAIQEIIHLSTGRILDLVEYVQLRRETFGAYTAALYVDISTGVMIPDKIRASREIQTLLGAFMDYMALSNDIFSYKREIDDEGCATNLVLIVKNFLGVPLWRAVTIANDLVGARLRQFEYTLNVEVPEAAARLNLNDAECAGLAAWGEGARDYLSGILAWHIKAARY